jgi:hypothetical protein
MESGYSGTPLPKKLGLKEGSRLRLLNPPQGFTLDRDANPGPFDVAVAFCLSAKAVETAFATLMPDLDPKGGIWIAWPKKASGVKTDCSDGVVREIGLATGLVDNKVCAIDETWSGLRFVVRGKDR